MQHQHHAERMFSLDIFYYELLPCCRLIDLYRWSLLSKQLHGCFKQRCTSTQHKIDVWLDIVDEDDNQFANYLVSKNVPVALSAEHFQLLVANGYRWKLASFAKNLSKYSTYRGFGEGPIWFMLNLNLTNVIQASYNYHTVDDYVELLRIGKFHDWIQYIYDNTRYRYRTATIYCALDKYTLSVDAYYQQYINELYAWTESVVGPRPETYKQPQESSWSCCQSIDTFREYLQDFKQEFDQQMEDSDDHTEDLRRYMDDDKIRYALHVLDHNKHWDFVVEWFKQRPIVVYFHPCLSPKNRTFFHSSENWRRIQHEITTKQILKHRILDHDLPQTCKYWVLRNIQYHLQVKLDLDTYEDVHQYLLNCGYKIELQDIINASNDVCYSSDEQSDDETDSDTDTDW